MVMVIYLKFVVDGIIKRWMFGLFLLVTKLATNITWLQSGHFVLPCYRKLLVYIKVNVVLFELRYI